jgi:hypothetical protein
MKTEDLSILHYVENDFTVLPDFQSLFMVRLHTLKSGFFLKKITFSLSVFTLKHQLTRIN